MTEGQAGCGACHQWGDDPVFDARGKCRICERTEAEIREAHGFTHLSEIEEGRDS